MCSSTSTRTRPQPRRGCCNSSPPFTAGSPQQPIPTSRFTASAAPNSRTWLGSPTDFRDSEGRPAKRLVLTTSFRVPAEILAAAERITAGGELPGAAGPVTPAPHAGRVEAYLFAQQSEEAEWIAGEVNRLHLVERMPFAAMAVLVRTKRRFLPELSRALDRSGIPHDPPDARLVDQAAVRVVFDCALAARHQDRPRPAHAGEADRAMRRLLLGPLFTLPLGVERELLRERVRSGLPWSDVLRANLPAGSALAELLDDHSWLDMQAAEGFWHLWTTLPQFATAVTDHARREERSAWAAFAQALERQADRDPKLTLSAYLDLAEQDDFEATPLLSYRPHGERQAHPDHPSSGQGTRVRCGVPRRCGRGGLSGHETQPVATQTRSALTRPIG